ncbi:hypothetical protein FGO68_gene8794 [Halteria grandinella]|uniref:Uncharacterized protein n=1 Tax=Halteria grandinella TaxID=5974 RepID=A0A8J8P1K6_HALGN|nr:hypothetical protein FGO68_gene8794 [Halteria grandinella]
MVVQKYMIEETLRNLNEDFKLEFPKVGGRQVMEMYTKATPIRQREFDKFDWYIYPFKNGTSEFYTTTAQQMKEIEYCFYMHYLAKVFTNLSPLLASKDIQHLSFKYGVFCHAPAKNELLFHNISPKKTASECYCDVMGNCYYSPLCRGFFISATANPNMTVQADLTIVASKDRIAMAVCAPLVDPRSESKGFIGTQCGNINPTYAFDRPNQGNLVMDLYFYNQNNTNYVIADNQDIVSDILKSTYNNTYTISGTLLGTPLNLSQLSSKRLIFKQCLRQRNSQKSTFFQSPMLRQPTLIGIIRASKLSNLSQLFQCNGDHQLFCKLCELSTEHAAEKEILHSGCYV